VILHVFNSAERESACVIDGLMHNEVVKSDIHSTDAFGFSKLVFAVSHLLGSAAAASRLADRRKSIIAPAEISWRRTLLLPRPVFRGQVNARIDVP
jgi:TnpA family transposase